MSLESFQPPVGRADIREPILETTQKLPVIKGKGEGIATNEQAALSLLDLRKPKKRSTTDQYIFQRQALATAEASTRPSTQPEDDTSANVVRDTPSPADVELMLIRKRLTVKIPLKFWMLVKNEVKMFLTQLLLRNEQLNLKKAMLDQTLVKHPSLDLRQSKNSWKKTGLDQTVDKVMWLLLDQTLSP
uniref:Uncharacterized protein n=1 Tax=Tanacetum cinerariifolium TaxID=118510 RepID=A0A699HZ27_TANCI|nr:hypothetical protein [Tanacetum cinerariifolium]